LVEQITQGAPADIFFSADPGWMDEAARRGLIRTDSRSNIMANDLVLIGPRSDAAPQMLSRAFDIAAVVAHGRVAMCDPQNDPAGRYARAGLTALGLWGAVQDDLAIAENTLGAVLLVDRGEAAAAAVFATDVRGAAHISVIGAFPANSHPPIVYPAALTVRSRNADAGRLLAFLKSSAAASILLSFGYLPA